MARTWDEAIQIVLNAAEGPLHYAEIAERVAAANLYEVGANPAASVAAIISLSLRSGSSPYQRVSQGVYGLKAKLATESKKGIEDSVSDSSSIETGALRAFGMYWQRDQVNWALTLPVLYGRQNPSASDVNFAGQVGVYLLHDRDRVIYVGRATDNLATRLRAHTADRLRGRWDRFSWFGLFDVDENGCLLEKAVPWSQVVVIETLEALLIESLEPPLNRRRGDNFAAVEYLQGIDPEIEQLKEERFIAELGSRLRRSRP